VTPETDDGRGGGKTVNSGVLYKGRHLKLKLLRGGEEIMGAMRLIENRSLDQNQGGRL